MDLEKEKLEVIDQITKAFESAEKPINQWESVTAEKAKNIFYQDKEGYFQWCFGRFKWMDLKPEHITDAHYFSNQDGPFIWLKEDYLAYYLPALMITNLTEEDTSQLSLNGLAYDLLMHTSIDTLASDEHMTKKLKMLVSLMSIEQAESVVSFLGVYEKMIRNANDPCLELQDIEPAKALWAELATEKAG